MSPEDRDEFDIDISYISWRMFMFLYMHGLKRYVIKNEANTEP